MDLYNVIKPSPRQIATKKKQLPNSSLKTQTKTTTALLKRQNEIALNSLDSLVCLAHYSDNRHP